MSNELISHQTSNDIVFSADKAGELMKFSEFMAGGKVMVPAHLQGKPADCMAIAMQAASWGMNPFSVAQKTHLVNGTLGYEAQLVNAVVTSSRAVKGRFHYEYIGDWSKWKCTAKNIGTQQQPKWKNEYHNEAGLAVRVGAILNGESEITWGEYVYIEFVKIRNSPLWQTNPKQQLAYLAVKYWSRLYCPEVLLGVYTPDELYEESEYNVSRGTEKVINPVDSQVDVSSVFDQKHEETVVDNAQSNQTAEDVFSNNAGSAKPDKAQELIDQINECETMKTLCEIGDYVSEHTNDFTKSELLSIKSAYQKIKTILEDS
ncbi:hypothetical protein vBVpPvVp04M_00011 [Vibrio phage vB_Vp_PvVp04_M]|nr:hypothetical protein vBVpPvVp04M_00011 [Vibrio phage vB_Vp_PvVp04_M]